MPHGLGVRNAVVTTNILNSDYYAERAITDQLYNHGIPACLKWSQTKNPCMTTYKIRAWQINSGETINFMGTRINFRGTKKFSRGVDKKIYGQTKNLRAATKIFGQLQKCLGTFIMFLGILNNCAGHIYSFRTLKKKKYGERKYFWIISPHGPPYLTRTWRAAIRLAIIVRDSATYIGKPCRIEVN